MSDIKSRLEESERVIKQIDSELLQIKKSNEMLLRCNAVRITEIENLRRSIEAYKVEQEKSIKLVYAWLFCSIAIAVLSLTLTQVGLPLLKFMEVGSSWLACLFLVFGGFYSAKLTYEIDKHTGYIVAAAWALISTCYIGYVLLDFGGSYPHAGAIGFNLGAIGQTFALLAVAKILKKNG